MNGGGGVGEGFGILQKLTFHGGQDGLNFRTLLKLFSLVKIGPIIP